MSQQIKFEQVFCSYNGKSGCMCGCNGSYKIPSHTNIDQANRQLGYNGYDESNISDRSVKIAVNKINKALIEDPNSVEFDEPGIYSIDDGSRTTVVYLKQSATSD